MSVELVCARCGKALPSTSRRSTCPCGGLLDVVQHPTESGRSLRARFDRRLRSGDPSVEGSGVWRFRELLLPGRGAVLTHPEGSTPLYRRDAISAFAGHGDLVAQHADLVPQQGDQVGFVVYDQDVGQGRGV